MLKKLIILFISLVIFSSFVIFSYLVHKNLLNQFDFDTTVRLQDHMSRRFDGVFSLFSDLGSFEVLTVLLLIVLVLRRKITGVIVFFLYGAIHILELFGKTFVDHLPPPQFMLRTEHLFNFPQFYVRSEFSYPSGHSARSIFLGIFISLILLKSKRFRSIKLIFIGLITVFDILMLVSRVYLGEHWTTDVIGGSLLGLSLGILASLF